MVGEGASLFAGHVFKGACTAWRGASSATSLLLLVVFFASELLVSPISVLAPTGLVVCVEVLPVVVGLLFAVAAMAVVVAAVVTVAVVASGGVVRVDFLVAVVFTCFSGVLLLLFWGSLLLFWGSLLVLLSGACSLLGIDGMGWPLMQHRIYVMPRATRWSKARAACIE